MIKEKEKAKVVETKGKDMNVFSEGVLLILDVRKWGATSKVDDGFFDDTEDIPKEIYSAMQSLLLKGDRDKLKELDTLKNETSGFLRWNSLPFPVRTLKFIPKTRIEKVNEFLEKKMEDWNMYADEISDRLEGMKSAYEEKYPKDYRGEKYPSRAQLRSKFKFSWSFRIFDLPNKNESMLSPELYKREVEKFKEDFSEMKRMTLDIAATEIVSRIDTLRKQCANEKINAGTIAGIQKTLTMFDEIWDGFIDSEVVRKKIGEIKEYMDGTDADMLRYNDRFRELVGNKMKEIADTIEAQPDIKLKRKLDI